PLYRPARPPDLHSFPTRRSSDLAAIDMLAVLSDAKGGACQHRVRRRRPVGRQDRGTRRPDRIHHRDEKIRTLTSIAIFSLRRKRSEEHTSELQSLAYLVCRLLLE